MYFEMGADEICMWMRFNNTGDNGTISFREIIVSLGIPLRINDDLTFLGMEKDVWEDFRPLLEKHAR